MARYNGARFKLIRRLGSLPGLVQPHTNIPEKPRGENKTVEKKKKPTQYAVRLIEKQKLRFNYGISEEQLLNYVKKAKKARGETGTFLLNLLELRLDTIVFRLGLAPTITAARQLVNHGHIYVNQQRVSIPSYQCRLKDIISLNTISRSKPIVSPDLNTSFVSSLPPHLTLDKETLTGKVEKLPQRQSVGFRINELLIVEYYSRKT